MIPLLLRAIGLLFMLIACFGVAWQLGLFALGASLFFGLIYWGK